MAPARSRSRRRDERGATAVIFGLLAVVLFGFGALAVDFGQAYAKKSLLQTDVDLAVMAAASELTAPGPCNPEVISTAEEFLNKSENSVPGQVTVDLGNGAKEDGYIECSGWKVSLWAPQAHVDYTLGRVISSEDGLDVQAYAAAQIRSAVAGTTLPFFAVDGCDSGAQTIRDSSGATTVPTVPPLTPTSATTVNATFTISPTSVPAGTTSAQITLTGSQLKDVDAVTFTGAAATDHQPVTVNPPSSSNSGPITVTVPSAVLAAEGVWYVRVMKAGEYSDTSDAQPFTVGDERLYCDDRNRGNFGTLDLPRNDTNSGSWLAWNMIKGIQPSLATHPSAPSIAGWTCDHQPGSVESVHIPVDGTNCVASKPGLDRAATNDGLITGSGGLPGRLDANSTSNCSRNQDDGRTPGDVNGKHLNDDLLTCFITNGAHIGDLVAGNSVGTQALSADIFASPRFLWLPVLASDASNGTKSWPIIRFVPGFITDQDLAATRTSPGTVSALNGIDGRPSGVEEVRVVLFSENALPEFAPARGGEGEYTGTGPKALVLVE
ncbi:hypothetical protein E8D34_18115 [Nocardioides sp. GY 10113]|uniref:TadE/TadG family type IV pilus assembly protein n=1 Tax=Nocardioides sp. GY 10113 TaxID=2569761 RepID=UPI0010A8FC98|nr:TadE/TadG family type IV pilus assembly protein [Nocardioides sp. GY 10113]TIC81309.1 hypothetical protein E8D34_18115 [Nocardioides sp. GY 10113]